MKAPKIVCLLLVVGVGAYFFNGCKPVWQYDHLERNARKVITGAELQNWATNLIALHRTNTQLSFRVADLGTNFPQQLKNLAPRTGPNVVVYQWEDTNQVPSVRVWWGSGFLGASGFEVGAANFEGPGHQWQPGIYFFKR